MAKKPRQTDAAGDSPLDFEAAGQRLDEIVRLLEDGQLPLADSLAHYEEGVRLLRQCHRLLQQAERKIELLAGVDAQGNPLTEPYDDEALSLEEKADRRGNRRTRSKRQGSDAATHSPDEQSDAPDDMDAPGQLF